MYFVHLFGALAQLARAFDWQSRGQGFDSPRLHKIPKLAFSYLLYSIKYDRFYIGFSTNLKVRLLYHNEGQVKSTKPYRPWEMVWYQKFESRKDAMARERKLKNLKSQKKVLVYICRFGKINPQCSSEFLKKIRESSKNL